MGERTILFDDLDGSEVGVEKREFTLDNTKFAVDLNEDNWTNFKKVLESAKIVDKSKRSRPARKRTKAAPPDPEKPAPSPIVPPTPAEAADHQIRAWARAHGYAVGERGALSNEVWTAWREARKENRAEPNGSTIHTS